MRTNFRNLIALLKTRKGPKNTDFTPPNPAIEFPHPENEPLFTRLRNDSTTGIPGVMGGYEARTHPDLTSILYDLIADPAVKTKKGYAFRRPVVATPAGLEFADAGGTRYIFLKLRQRRDDARRDGGRFDPTYGEDWLEFSLGPRIGASADWKEAMRRWASISYEDSLSLRLGRAVRSKTGV
jgi:hypothetical protein